VYFNSAIANKNDETKGINEVDTLSAFSKLILADNQAVSFSNPGL
jgi:hypothetical protein